MLKQSIISYESNVMLAAILCLILVILFVLLLQIYAKWFLVEAQQRQTRATISMARVLSQVHLGQEHSTTYTYDIASHSGKQTQGLDISVIDSIPIFIYGSNGQEPPLECAICLSIVACKEVVRSLPRCSHAFHVECIDMWLYSHSTCPICRAQVVETEVDEWRSKDRDDHSVAMDGVDETVATTEAYYSRTLAEMLEEVNEEVVNNVFSSFDSSLRMLLTRNRTVNSVYASSPVGTIDVGTIV